MTLVEVQYYGALVEERSGYRRFGNFGRPEKFKIYATGCRCAHMLAEQWIILRLTSCAKRPEQ